VKIEGELTYVIHCDLSCCTLLLESNVSSSASCGKWLNCGTSWLGPVWAFTVGSIIVGVDERNQTMAAGVMMWQMHVTW